jgi:hypothetical protein
LSGWYLYLILFFYCYTSMSWIRMLTRKMWICIS